MPLVNVRLDADDARLAADLRGAGVPISRVVREAIRAEHARRMGLVRRSRRPSQIVKEIIASLPDLEDMAGRIDPSDRRAVQRHIVARLRSRQ
jgi:post-segregation antitoxin (ccd killing protein)